jgi:hypothetical protein
MILLISVSQITGIIDVDPLHLGYKIKSSGSATELKCIEPKDEKVGKQQPRKMTFALSRSFSS